MPRLGAPCHCGLLFRAEADLLAKAITAVANSNPECSQCEFEHRIGRRQYLCRSCERAVEWRDDIINNINREAR
jgi:tRNA(Ile2) C34 agmatinyltransferase TiaS